MWQIYALTALEMIRERQREEAALAAHRRTLHELRDEAASNQAGSAPSRESAMARLAAAFRGNRQDDHSLTDYPCRLPDGTMGRVAVVAQDGEWNLVCRRA